MSREAMDTRQPPQRTNTLVPQNLACSEDDDGPVSAETPPVACPPSSRWNLSCDPDDVFDAVSKGAKRPTIPLEAEDRQDDGDLFSLVSQALLSSDVFSYEGTRTEEEIERASGAPESQRWSEPPEEAPATQREPPVCASEDEDPPSRRAWSPETWDALVAKAREHRQEEPRSATEPTHVRVQRLIEEGFSQLRDGNPEAAWEPWMEAHRLEPENRACRANIRRLAEKLGRKPPSHDE